MKNLLSKFFSKKWVQIAAIAALLLALCYPVLRDYLHLSLSANFLWLVLLPFVIYVKFPGRYSYRFAVPAVGCIVGYLLVSSPFFVFLALCFTILFLIESQIGLLNRLAPAVVILITPLTKYFFEVFSFPIRLKLTSAASALMNFAGYSNTVSGNLINVGDATFSVDTACMGLKLVITSLLICLLFVSWFEKKQRSSLKSLATVGLLVGAFGFVVVANFMRIVLLVVLQSPAESFSHEMIGIVCLLVCVVAPLYLSTQKLSETGAMVPIKLAMAGKSRSIAVAFPVFLVLMVGFTGLSFKPGKDIPRDKVAENVELYGYEKEILENRVVQFTRDETIVFIKPNKGFYRSNHHPFICWRGSGFTILNERMMELGETEIFVANLASEDKNLVTAWWFDNGKDRTISQTHWRWDMLKGSEPYRLVNVTSNDLETLFMEVNYLMGVGMLSGEGE